MGRNGKNIKIAIDGPSGAGKSTIARAIAGELGYIYVDTGAIYRAVGLYGERNGAGPGNREAIVRMLPEMRVELKYFNGEQRVFLNGEDVSEAIRAHEISRAASDVSAIPEVRRYLLELQREMARVYDVVMDGRDIGTVILPDADVKIFLTASAEDRARRRWLELKKKGNELSYERVLSDILERDKNDCSRAEAPLRQAEDAVLADTTGNELEKSILELTNLVKEKLCDVL